MARDLAGTMMSRYTDVMNSKDESVSDTQSKKKVLHKLLIVEDERLFAQLLCDALSDIEGTEVEIAHNGREALVKISESNYDLILTDIQMPEMNGKELLKTIRSHDEKVGILVLTAFPEVDYIREFNDLGIEDFLSKVECDLENLQNLVVEYFRRKEIEFLSDSF